MFDLSGDLFTLIHNETANRHTEYCHLPETIRKLEMSIMEYSFPKWE